MDCKSKTRIVTFLVLLACVFTVRANAECGDLSKFKFGAYLRHQSWRGSELNGGQLLRVADSDESGESIVGFWKVTFTSEGTTGIPDGTVIDSAYAQWHSDGTEIMNSSRPPATQSFCLGVWKHIGGLKYKLNHFAISWDSHGNLVGPANIREEVILNPDGESFDGTFTIDQFDLVGNTLAHLTGVLAGTRITADSPANVAF
jgi:hypothetical protein